MTLHRICIVVAPIGPRCAVRTDAGVLIRGHRVPSNFPRGTSDTVIEGYCVRFRTVDKDGKVVFDDNGKQQTHLSANGWSFDTLDNGCITEWKYADPPPLQKVTPRWR